MVIAMLWLVGVATAWCGQSPNSHEIVPDEKRMHAALNVAQSSDAERIERIVVAYLQERKKWTREQYRIDHKEATKEGYAVVWAIFLEDEKQIKPGGGGSSVELHVDRSAGKVVRELRFQ